MDVSQLNHWYPKIKQVYLARESQKKGKEYKKQLETIEQYGYLPVPYEVAQTEIGTAALFAGLEKIWAYEGSMREGRFVVQSDKDVNPLVRLGYDNRIWITREQHKIESLNLMGLTQTVGEKICGSFRNLLVKILTTANGCSQEKIAATTFYLLPPYHRDGAFNAAYCPASAEIEPRLADPQLEQELGLTAEDQIRLFILLANMAGHPVVIDLLPQAGRYAKTVFVYPDCFRWFSIQPLLKALVAKLDEVHAIMVSSTMGINRQAREVAIAAIHDDILGMPLTILPGEDSQSHNLKTAVRTIYHEFAQKVLKEEKKKTGSATGIAAVKLQERIKDSFKSQEFPDLQNRFYLESVTWLYFFQTFTLFCETDLFMEDFRITISNQQMAAASQATLAQNIRQKIEECMGGNLAQESDLDNKNHLDLITLFQKEGWWPASGGSWNSAGHPILHRMSPLLGSLSYPIFDHYSYSGCLVNAFTGDMDITSPWYFAYLDKSDRNEDNLNRPVISRYIAYCQGIYERLRPNGFRIDHLDHSHDHPFSLNSKGNPISYRAPLAVFQALGERIRKQFDPTFVLFAEYMGWGDSKHPHLYHAYHEYGIDLAISTDVVGEFRVNARVMIEEGNGNLEKYNKIGLPGSNFSCTKILDNHDRYHPDILPQLSEFTPERALLKWMKCLFLPGGRLAERPVLYLDGNQTHTPNQAFAETFLNAKSLTRSKNWAFFSQFDALLRFSLAEPILIHGRAQMLDTLETLQRKSEKIPAPHNTVSIWIVLPPAMDSKLSPLVVISHEHIDDKTATATVVPIMEVILPENFQLAGEVMLPNPAIQNGGGLSASIKSIVSLTEKPVAQVADVTASPREDGLFVMRLPCPAVNRFRIFRLRRQ